MRLRGPCLTRLSSTHIEMFSKTPLTIYLRLKWRMKSKIFSLDKLLIFRLSKLLRGLWWRPQWKRSRLSLTVMTKIITFKRIAMLILSNFPNYLMLCHRCRELSKRIKGVVTTSLEISSLFLRVWRKEARLTCSVRCHHPLTNSTNLNLSYHSTMVLLNRSIKIRSGLTSYLQR